MPYAAALSQLGCVESLAYSASSILVGHASSGWRICNVFLLACWDSIKRLDQHVQRKVSIAPWTAQRTDRSEWLHRLSAWWRGVASEAVPGSDGLDLGEEGLFCCLAGTLGRRPLAVCAAWPTNAAVLLAAAATVEEAA